MPPEFTYVKIRRGIYKECSDETIVSTLTVPLPRPTTLSAEQLCQDEEFLMFMFNEYPGWVPTHLLYAPETPQ